MKKLLLVFAILCAFTFGLSVDNAVSQSTSLDSCRKCGYDGEGDGDKSRGVSICFHNSDARQGSMTNFCSNGHCVTAHNSRGSDPNFCGSFWFFDIFG